MLLTILRMSYGEAAIAKDPDGKTIFVPGAVVGDTVEAHIVKDEGRYATAKIDTIVEASKDRVQISCPPVIYAGAAPWAHIAYEAQLRFKRQNVVDSLIRLGHMPDDAAEALVAPTIAPSEIWGYRNKIELQAKQLPGSTRTICGMSAANSSELIKVNENPLMDKKFAKISRSVTGAISYISGSYDLKLHRVGIRASKRTKEIEVALWTEPGSFPRAHVAKILSDATSATSIVRVVTKGAHKARKVATVECLRGHGNWSELLGSEKMCVSAPSFFQVNTKGAEVLQNLVLEGLDVQPDDIAMDLYSGAGTFTLPLARKASWVDAVESYGPAVRDLRRNIERARLDNVEAIGGDANLEFPDSEADVIVVDPPRAGLAKEVVEKLSQQPARAIAYVSCDPATLARDIERFQKLGRFVPEKIVPVDLFAQSYHVENVCVLRRA